MKWVIKRKKSNVFEITSVADYMELTESYTLLYISENQKMEFEHCAIWVTIAGVDTIQAPKGSPVYEKFFALAKEKLSANKIYNFSKKVISTVAGTSRLVRTSKKDRIYIARRKGTDTLNETKINSVCIDNKTRNEFFEDVKRKHNGLPFLGKYEFLLGDEYFAKWSSIMDKLYLEQTNQ